MGIDDWNRIIYIPLRGTKELEWINYQAPKQALDLIRFSQYVAGWLPKGKWKILQIDNSTGRMSPAAESLFGGLLFGCSKGWPSLVENRTFFFELGKGKEKDNETELLIANLIFVFLLFEYHGYVVSSNCPNKQYLGIQDGFVYFHSTHNEDIRSAQAALKKFEANEMPTWVLDIIAEQQEKWDATLK